MVIMYQRFMVFVMTMIMTMLFTRAFKCPMQARTILTSTRVLCRIPTATSVLIPNYQRFHPRTSSLRMMSSITTTESTRLTSLLVKPTSDSAVNTQFVFVGGKGGVGKTSSSSALAISMSDAGLRTLVVSTDPAHSLGDALDVNLSSGHVTPITTETNLWALEIDVDQAIEEFQSMAQSLNTEKLAESLGVPRDIIEALGISDLASIFTNPPPGVDEIVALTKIFQYADEKLPNGNPKYERIIIDTAPTGHTIRLLQLPAFLNSVTGKLIKFRAKLMGALETFKGLFGGGDNAAATLGGALGRIEELQTNVARVKATLTDPSKTQFVVVTIPTSLAVAESKRLVTSLRGEGIRVSTILCNQIVADDAGPKYIDTRRMAQRQCINKMNNAATVSAAAADSMYPTVEITEVPYVDTEITGIYGLRFFSNLAHAPKPKTATNPINARKLTIFGGKGGVGKTTSAASWGVLLSDSGMKTLVMSTDPAHSLGDAFGETLTGVPRMLDQNAASGGQLWAMEIDPDAALAEFQELIQGAMGKSSSTMMDGAAGGMGLPDFKNDITDMLSGVNDPPPGTDEIVAMTKVVTFLEEGCVLPNGQTIKFDRIVLDTAPTGHTMRMLQLPDFLTALVQKLKKIRDKAGTIGGMMGMMGGGGGGGRSTEKSEEVVDSERRLEKFEKRMERLDELLHSPREAEFTVVTIPTEVATAETVRLLSSLKDESIGMRRVIINQVLPNPINDNKEEADIATTAFLNRLRQGQQTSIRELQTLADNTGSAQLIKVPYFDMEVRTVYGLRVVGTTIFANAAK